MVRHVRAHAPSYLAVLVPLIVQGVMGYWQAQKDEAHNGRTDGVAALAVSISDLQAQQAGELAILKARLDRDERMLRRAGHRGYVPRETVYVAPKAQEQSHGFLWHLLHPTGR